MPVVERPFFPLWHRKLGAREVEAFDIRRLERHHGRENIEINDCKNIQLHQGRISEIGLTGMFDIILATSTRMY